PWPPARRWRASAARRGSNVAAQTPPGARLSDCRESAMKSPRLVSDPEILGGTPVFVGTRVPMRILFEHLAAGDALEVFLEDFPSVSREVAIEVLEDAKRALELDAHPA
ncbi:MAG: DUF433 domain-containing protein, partial [Burkholderiales bacterium]|nr:DUF433 domain-containing protein [Burkholderiales bacterium]